MHGRQQPVGAERRIVDEPVERAELLAQPLHQARDRLGLAEIERDEMQRSRMTIAHFADPQRAFDAAADPNRFPEQIAEGLRPWQAKKLYLGNVCQFFAQTCPDKDYTVKLNTGEEDPLLGMSYIQLALEGLRHQLSQGLGGLSLPSGPRYTFYRLVDSVLPPTADKDGHEQNFFDGIETSLPGLAARLAFPHSGQRSIGDRM